MEDRAVLTYGSAVRAEVDFRRYTVVTESHERLARIPGFEGLVPSGNMRAPETFAAFFDDLQLVVGEVPYFQEVPDGLILRTALVSVRRISYGSPLEVVLAAGAGVPVLFALLRLLRDWSAERDERRAQADELRAAADVSQAWAAFYGEYLGRLRRMVELEGFDHRLLQHLRPFETATNIEMEEKGQSMGRQLDLPPARSITEHLAAVERLTGCVDEVTVVDE